MRLIQRLIFISILFQLFSTAGNSTNRYVDKNANGLNNGTSWANAWKSFSVINWSSIQPGDVIYISGGTDSTVYYAPLSVGASGSWNNYIYIMPGKYSPSPSGHSGRVIIDGNDSFANALYIYNRYWIYVKGLEIRHTSGEGLKLHYNPGHIVIDSCKIYECKGFHFAIIGTSSGGPGMDMDDWDSTDYVYDVEVKNCTLYSYKNYPYGNDDDIFQINGAHNIKIHHNFINERNLQIGVPPGNHKHIDPIQSLNTRGLWIWNNIIKVDSAVYGHDLIIDVQSRPGGLDTCIIYNNYIIHGGHLNANGNPYTQHVFLRWYNEAAEMAPTYVLHNTIFSANGSGPIFECERDAVIKNNIIYDYGTLGQNPANYGGQQVGFMTSTNVGTQHFIEVDSCNGNLLYRAWGNVGFGGGYWEGAGGSPHGNPSGWSGWVNNYGGDGINSDPLIIGNWRNGILDLSPNSPAIDAGKETAWVRSFIESKGLPWTDIYGNPRDNTPTIGAYEFVTGGGGNNYPPNQPSNPNPGNGSTNQLVNLSTAWNCTDPDGDPLTYDVYFGTNNNPPIVVANQSNSNYNPGQLNNNTNYYWKIVAKDNHGHSTSGNIWSFTTVSAILNNPPYPPSNPNPGNGSTNQSTNLTIMWTCTDPDGNLLSYDVYFGNIDDPPLVSSNQSNSNFNPGTLNSNTTYYWRIVAKDNQGLSTSGLVWSFSTLNIDQTPPTIVNAELQDSATLKIWFSEPIQQPGAQNISNYSISNGIQVVSASLSGSEVTLSTTEHTSGNYSVIVTNVKDLSGNLIAPPNNSAQYEYSINQIITINLELKIFLDGPYTNNSMTTYLSNNSLLPLSQPYSVMPWNYYGSETVNQIPQNTVDWVLIELRTNTSASSIVCRKAVFLRSDGIIMDLDGDIKISFSNVQIGSYYVVVYHRNHLAIMSKNLVPLSVVSSMYDFTLSQNKAYGNQPMKSLDGGKYGMYAADGNANGNINNSDNSSVWKPENGSIGYKKGDFDLNGGVNTVDKNAKWNTNKGKISYVPKN